MDDVEEYDDRKIASSMDVKLSIENIYVGRRIEL